MKTIYKYELEITDDQSIKVKGTPISVVNQNEDIVIYTLCDPSETGHYIDVHIAGTGHPISDEIIDSYKFLGTVSLFKKLVFHVFYRKEDEDVFEKIYAREEEKVYRYC